VNTAERVNLGGRLEADALRVLRQVPGLEVIAEPRGHSGRPDFLMRYGGKRTHVVAEVKRHANAATAWQLVHYAEALGKRRLVLIADYTTEEARQILTDHGIGVVDGVGNVHMELPGLLVHLEGRPGRRPPATAPPTRLRGKAGIAAQALLLHPERQWRVSDLATEAKVAKGLAHRVLARLEGEAVVTAEGSGPNRIRRVTDATALLDLWAEENVDEPRRTTGYLLAQTPRQLIEKLGRNLERAGVDHALTGAAGASLVAPFVTALPVADVWVTAAVAREELHEAAQADAVSEGPNIAFLQAEGDGPLTFRERHSELWIADRFRLYLDLRRDPRRGREQADHLRQEVIGF
jgi:hypothetical protein